MSKENQKFTDEQYLEAGEYYFGDDDETKNHTYKLLKTRKDHDCMSIDHKGDKKIPSGSKALFEKAIHVDMGRVSCWICMLCLNDWCAVIFYDEND